jgi:hypothetical protein
LGGSALGVSILGIDMVVLGFGALILKADYQTKSGPCNQGIS